MIVMHYGIGGLSSLMIKSVHFVAKDFYFLNLFRFANN